MIRTITTVVFICMLVLSSFAQKGFTLNGIIVDQNNKGLPYVAVSIPAKNKGTSSNADGNFSLKVLASDFKAIIEISSLGFKTKKITVEAFLKKKTKSIVLFESVATLDEISLLLPLDYIKLAKKHLKNNTLSSRHQLAILSRRFSIEYQKPRFLVEQYVKVLDKGPVSSDFLKIGVVESRKSVDYRFLKLKQGKHSLAYMTDNNPLRSANFDKKYTWERVGTTTYDGEDVIILKGTSKKSAERVRFYIGMDTYGIFKIDMSALNAVYIYKKNSEGKLYLSYHNREYKTKKTINKIQKTILKIRTDTIDLAYRHEAIVLNVETDKNNSKFKSFGGYNIDMGDINLPYHPEFWNRLQTPPQSSFFKRSKRELEQLYGVSLGIQFELSNTKQKKE